MQLLSLKTRERRHAGLSGTGRKNVDVLVKNIDFDPLTKKYMALDFQALVAGEVVSATVPIVYLNEDKVQGIFEAELSEVHYKADPRTSVGSLRSILQHCPRRPRPCM